MFRAAVHLARSFAFLTFKRDFESYSGRVAFTPLCVLALAVEKTPTEMYRKSLIYSKVYVRLVLSLILLRHRKNSGFNFITTVGLPFHSTTQTVKCSLNCCEMEVSIHDSLFSIVFLIRVSYDSRTDYFFFLPLISGTISSRLNFGVNESFA